MISLENKKLHDYIVLKDELVNEGRKLSGEMEKKDKEIVAFQEKEKKITSKVNPPKELEEEGNALAQQMDTLMKRLEVIGNEVEDFKLAAIPQEMKDDHNKALKEREEMERKLNKLALKVQKVKDKVIPIVQKEVKPFLKEYDDIETAQVKDGKVIIRTFNHLEDWKAKFNR